MAYAETKAKFAPSTMRISWVSLAQAKRIQLSGEILMRYGLVLILVWIGGMKFTAFEAAAIQPLVASSPLMNWIYKFLSPQTVSNLLGVVEISAAGMVAARPLSARVAALGSAVAVLMFLTTLTFLFTLPDWEPSLGGFPALSGAGGFLVKDVALLGIAVWSLGEALAAAAQDAHATGHARPAARNASGR